MQNTARSPGRGESSCHRSRPARSERSAPDRLIDEWCTIRQIRCPPRQPAPRAPDRHLLASAITSASNSSGSQSAPAPTDLHLLTPCLSRSPAALSPSGTPHVGRSRCRQWRLGVVHLAPARTALRAREPRPLGKSIRRPAAVAPRRTDATTSTAPQDQALAQTGPDRQPGSHHRGSEARHGPARPDATHSESLAPGSRAGRTWSPGWRAGMSRITRTLAGVVRADGRFGQPNRR